jgi:hypothetical protein
MDTAIQRRHWGVRLIAVILGVGAGLGVYAFALVIPSSFQANILSGLLACILLLFLLATVWIAIGLWQWKNWAAKWAMIVLAMQVPLVAIPGFSYTFFTLVHFTIHVGTPTFGFNFNAGYTSFEVTFAQSLDTWRVGFNIVPIFALFYLQKIFFQKNQQQAASG